MNSMKSVVLASVTSAILGGAAAGAAVATLADSEAPARKAATKTQPKDAKAGDQGKLELRILDLESRLSTMQRQEHVREKLQTYAKALNRADPDDSGEPSQGMEGVVDGEDPTFELAVRSVLDRVDWEKDEERKVVRAQQHNERAQRQTDLLATRLKLDAGQKKALGTLLASQMEKFRALRDPDAGGQRPATRSEWREKTTEIRKQTEQELAKVLTPEQMKEYSAFAEEEGFGPGRGRPRNRGAD
jgi:hypothetical protein